jgi:hypothetical protein
MNGAELARKYGRDGRSLRNLLRANPELMPGHVHGTHYEIYEADEERIRGHAGFAGVARAKS